VKPVIIKENVSKEYYTPERCFILELTGPQIDENVSIARARVKPGVTTARHILNGIDEQYIMIGGQGKMELGDLPPTEVLAGDVIIIPAGVSQRITNTGGDDLIFYCICTPPFTPECYRDIDDE
jgi:mannose-6-phosphate isomerase-like protein (cupin superfamily)